MTAVRLADARGKDNDDDLARVRGEDGDVGNACEVLGASARGGPDD
jgi:hypothetical protein